jgi:hypothetical protein
MTQALYAHMNNKRKKKNYIAYGNSEERSKKKNLPAYLS